MKRFWRSAVVAVAMALGVLLTLSTFAQMNGGMMGGGMMGGYAGVPGAAQQPMGQQAGSGVST